MDIPSVKTGQQIYNYTGIIYQIIYTPLDHTVNNNKQRGAPPPLQTCQLQRLQVAQCLLHLAQLVLLVAHRRAQVHTLAGRRLTLRLLGRHQGTCRLHLGLLLAGAGDEGSLSKRLDLCTHARRRQAGVLVADSLL